MNTYEFAIQSGLILTRILDLEARRISILMSAKMGRHNLAYAHGIVNQLDMEIKNEKIFFMALAELWFTTNEPAQMQEYKDIKIFSRN